MLRWYRSWPSDGDMATCGELPHVVDRLPRLIMAGQNYKSLGEYQPWPDDRPGFCLLEWDIALDPWGRQAFAAEALLAPREILVAPYRFHDTWVTWLNTGAPNPGAGPDPIHGRPSRPGDERADSFGLGCIYIPQPVLQEFLAQMDHFGFTDGTFGAWYHERYGPVRLTWRVMPQHLHDYDPEVL